MPSGERTSHRIVSTPFTFVEADPSQRVWDPVTVAEPTERRGGELPPAITGVRAHTRTHTHVGVHAHTHARGSGRRPGKSRGIVTEGNGLGPGLVGVGFPVPIRLPLNRPQFPGESGLTRAGCGRLHGRGRGPPMRIRRLSHLASGADEVLEICPDAF